jgi:hypothetical protein
MATNANRRSRRAETPLRLTTEETLDQSVLKGMKADNYNPATASQEIE